MKDANAPAWLHFLWAIAIVLLVGGGAWLMASGYAYGYPAVLVGCFVLGMLAAKASDS